MRAEIDKLPLLDASDTLALPDKYLPRAAVLLGSIAHSYWHITRTYRPMPPNLRKPWEQITARLERLGLSYTMDGLLSLNPYDPNYIDPILWSKTVAPFGVPREDVFGGTSGLLSPVFILLDYVIGRKKYETEFGIHASKDFAWLPKIQRDFITEVGKVSISRFCQTK